MEEPFSTTPTREWLKSLSMEHIHHVLVLESRLRSLQRKVNLQHSSVKRTQISEKNKYLQDELTTLRITLELLETPVEEPVKLGKGVTIWGHCHHRGYRNDARHACEYVKCIGFRYCGHQKLHPEHTQEISDAKRNNKRLENEKRKGDEALKANLRHTSSPKCSHA